VRRVVSREPTAPSPGLDGEPTSAGAAASRPGPVRPALGASSLVALGILGSRISGLVRERFIGHYFGITLVADAFRQASRVPNLLSNLFGEGVLSASFVTVYAKLRALGKDDEAEQLAAAVFGLLSLVCAVAVVLGVVLTPFLIDVIAPGFTGERRVLTIQIVRVLFPGTGVLVMSAWCLGVLNSHGRFLLSYLAPVATNATMIGALIVFGARTPSNRLVMDAAWAYVAGNVLSFLVQLPPVLRILPSFRPVLEWQSEHVRSVVRNFGPIFLSRGVVQISALIDSTIASWLPTGAVAVLGPAQVISVLPISLFSMSVTAAELPALSSAVGTQQEVSAFLRRRLAAGLRRIAFFIVPSAVGFLVLGDVIGAALYQTGKFTHADVLYLWSVLAGSSVGLLASSLGRLYSSAFYSLLDTRTPLRFAVIRVVLTTLLGLVFALLVPHWLGINPRWGAAGLTASAGIAGWVEFALLRRALHGRIGDTALTAAFTLKLWAVALLGAAIGYSFKIVIGAAFGSAHPILLALVVLPLYGAIYFGGTMLLGIPEAKSAFAPILRRAGLR